MRLIHSGKLLIACRSLRLRSIQFPMTVDIVSACLFHLTSHSVLFIGVLGLQEFVFINRHILNIHPDSTPHLSFHSTSQTHI